MKKTILGMAAATLLFAGCSKEELVDETMPSEGVSSVASTPGQEKNFWSSAPSIWFNENNGRMLVRLKSDPPQGGTIRADIRITFQNGGGQITVDPNDDPTNEEFETVVDLQRIGNSRIFRSAPNAADLPEEFDFSLANINLSAGEEEVWNGDVFLYPSGRTVAQDPAIARLRISPDTEFEDGSEGQRIAVVIADDPTGQVAGVRFSAVVEDADGVQSERVSTDLDLGQLNQNLGLARYLGRQLKRETDRLRSKTLEFTGSGSYGVDFLDEAANTVIIRKYDIAEEGTGFVPTTEVDEPEFLGTALRSKTGESWTYEVAIADLGGWVESATLTFPEQEGVFPTQNEFDMQLIRSEGNLKVFQVDRILFEGLEFGTDVQADVQARIGTGTRSTSSQASTRAELL